MDQDHRPRVGAIAPAIRTWLLLALLPGILTLWPGAGCGNAVTPEQGQVLAINFSDYYIMPRDASSSEIPQTVIDGFELVLGIVKVDGKDETRERNLRWAFEFFPPKADAPWEPDTESLAATQEFATIKDAEGLIRNTVPLNLLSGVYFVRFVLTYDIFNGAPNQRWTSRFASFSWSDCPIRVQPIGYPANLRAELGEYPVGDPVNVDLRIGLEAGLDPIQFTAIGNPPLPPGLALSTNGILTGTASPGTFTFRVRAVDACQSGRVSEFLAQIRFISAEECIFAPAISALSTVNGTAGTSFEATGTLMGSGTITLEIAREGWISLPSWLSYELTDARSFRLFGTPPAPQVLAIIIRATDSCDPPKVTDRTETLTFTACGDAPVLPASLQLPAAVLGQPYSYTIPVTGGTGEVSLVLLAAPAWLTATGTTLSGTPTSAGRFTVRMVATDGCAQVSAEQSPSLRVVDESPGLWNAYSSFISNALDYTVLVYQDRPVILYTGLSNVPGEGGLNVVTIAFGQVAEPRRAEDWQTLRLDTIGFDHVVMTPALAIHNGRLAALFKSFAGETRILKLMYATANQPLALSDWVTTSVPLGTRESDMLFQYDRLTLASIGGRLATMARNRLYLSTTGAPVDPPASNWTVVPLDDASVDFLFRYRNPQLVVADNRLWALICGSQSMTGGPMEHLVFRADQTLPDTTADWTGHVLEAGGEEIVFGDFRPTMLIRSDGRPALSFYKREPGALTRTRRQHVLLATTTEPAAPEDWVAVKVDAEAGGSATLMEAHGRLFVAYTGITTDYGTSSGAGDEPRALRLAQANSLHPASPSNWEVIVLDAEPDDRAAELGQLDGRLVLFDPTGPRTGLLGAGFVVAYAVAP